MIENHHTGHHHGRHLLYGIAAFVAATAVVLWAWNTLAAGLFGAPAFAFRHAVAATAVLALLSVVARGRRRAHE